MELTKITAEEVIVDIRMTLSELRTLNAIVHSNIVLAASVMPLELDAMRQVLHSIYNEAYRKNEELK